MILEEKTYKSKEIAEWMGITSNSLSRRREEKLKELSLYCDFKETSTKKIKVTKVYTEEYCKDVKTHYSEVKEVVLDYVNDNNLDTCINIATKIKEKLFPGDNITPKLGTVYVYVARALQELREEGQITFSRHDGIKKGENGSATFRNLTAREEELKHEAAKVYSKKENVPIEVILDSFADDEELEKRGINLSKNDLKEVIMERASIDRRFNFMAYKQEIEARLALRGEESYSRTITDFNEKDTFPIAASKGDFKWEDI